MNILHLLFFASFTFAGSGPSEAEKAALAETEARIKVLKAEGKLPDSPEPSSTRAPAKVPEGCLRLGVGEAAVINHTSREESPTGVAAQYGLSRPEEKKYLVEVNPKFVKGAGYLKEEDAKTIHEKYRSLVGKCFKEYEGKLKDEKTGKVLEIRLTDNSSVPEVKIEIMADDFRSNSKQYEGDISCPIVLHETLHLLGLADEYPDKPGLAEVYLDCRPAGPEDSIMAHHWKAVNALQPRMGYSIEKCKCDVAGAACWELAMKSKGNACPPGSTSFFEKLDPTIKTSLNVLNSNESFVLDAGKMKEIGFQPATRDSVLYPAHFRAITQPGCRDVNETYYACSLNSYRHSKPLPGEELGDPRFGCLPTPEACRWRRLQWLD